MSATQPCIDKDRSIVWLCDRVLARFGRPITHMHLCTHTDTSTHTHTHAYIPSLVPRKKINEDKTKTNCHKCLFKKDSLIVQGGGGACF